MTRQQTSNEPLFEETHAFLASGYHHGKRAWISAKGAQVYLRLTQRAFLLPEDELQLALDIASVELAKNLRGQGWFRRYLKQVSAEANCPNYIILECIHSPQLLQHATKYWHPLPHTPQTYFLTKEELQAIYASV